MMRPKRINHLSFVLLLSFLLAACSGPAAPTAAPDTSSQATAVAATLTAMVTQAVPTATNESHVLPSPTPNPAPAAATAVFVNIDHNVYIWHPSDSAFTQITSTGDAQKAYASPDGSLVAFTRTTDNQVSSLDIVRSDGANHRTLFSHEQFQALPRPQGTLDSAPSQLQWIPNSHLLAMTVYVILEGPGSMIGHDLIVINADDGSSKTLLSEDESWQFAYSPDGTKIAVSLPDGVNLYDSNGKALAPDKFFGFPNVNTASEYQYTPTISWKGDSTAFAFTVPPIDPFSDPNGKTSVILVNAADASYSKPLSTGMMYQSPQEFSPDLSHFAYTQRVDATTNTVDLHITALDGSMDKIYAADQKVFQFDWSPDNQHFLYAFNDGTNNIANLGSINEAGTRITQVTSMKEAEWVDATHYLIVDKDASGWKIWYGALGSAPSVVYSDALVDDGSTSLEANR